MALSLTQRRSRTEVAEQAPVPGPGGNGHGNGQLPQLDDLDCFLVKQEVEHFEAITGIETENSYQVLGATNSRAVFGPVLAKESSSFVSRMCCGNRRPWTIRIGPAPHVLVVQRPLKFFFHEVHAYSADGTFLGTVKRQCQGFPFQRNFAILDETGELVLRVTCPFLSLGWNFTLRDGADDRELGNISKKWSGIAQELFTDADNFGVGFPADLPSNFKALVLAAVFLIDFCFFESDGNSSSRRRR
mmetsp:Transcript_60922/g.170373  ORF Transcript_60922/g.170373 Transcript_60922/m.170373 type:complete len:245 (+) Transcript_60922:57-791(+)